MSSSTSTISDSLKTVRSEITRLAAKYDRDPSTITLLAVSKTKPVELIRAANDAGQTAFGENYPDEAFEKLAELESLNCEWHFIGSIQSRKAAGIARQFDWVHSVDRLKVASKLAQNRPAHLSPLQICLQVNIDNEQSKSGVTPETAAELAAQCAELGQLKLRGLMAIPKPESEFAKQRDAFRRVRELQDSLRKYHPSMDTLSMGMSGDLEAAIAEGASIVRVGTAIFGAREPRQ